ncbi:Hpt domain-containing protein [Profundibacterium mesophilum]|uniref:Hybrid sensory kinase n=1 Tax=Profundibacterium mesophilum KAUST100406-0324 TaxID=1037889 RepID=A0A921NXC9_9RHOB|nr:Hpt domain-containing protein [Profundibacterium mesophilum]KAF0676479.1 Hybrid sensory kinase [Profundibacterium mesophilum KAUST100406-0324]
MTQAQAVQGADSALSALRTRFVERLTVTIERLDMMAESLAEGIEPSTNLVGIIDELHRLSGIAGSFGYAELGVEAAELEMAFREVRRTEEAHALLDKLDVHVARIDEITNGR